MRFLVVLLAFALAGCSTAPGSPEAPTGPIHQGSAAVDESGAPLDIEHVPMDPVTGSVSAWGIQDTHCNVITGGGGILYGRANLDFKLASNATSLSLTADWIPSNPTIETLDFELRSGGSILATVGGSPGLQATVDITGVPPEDRAASLQITPPLCTGDPIAVKHYDDVVANIRIEFA